MAQASETSTIEIAKFMGYYKISSMHCFAGSLACKQWLSHL